MIASAAVLVLPNVPLALFPNRTESTLSMQTNVLIAALVQVFALLKLLRLSNFSYITYRGDGGFRFLPFSVIYEFNMESTMITTYNSETERLDEINESLSLISLKKGLTFGTDSYLLAAFAHPNPNGRCVEFGGGTGVVSLLCASKNKFSHITCAEIQEYFASLIRRNAEMNSLDHKITSVNSDIRELFPADLGGEVHAVISNPPYMKVTHGRENSASEMSIARREKNGTIRDFTSAAARLLKFGGYFTVVYRPDRLSELLSAMTDAGLEPKRLVLVYSTVEDKPCLVLAEGKKGASPGITVARPLVIYKKKGATEYTDEMQAVYDTFSTEHLF